MGMPNAPRNRHALAAALLLAFALCGCATARPLTMDGHASIEAPPDRDDPVERGPDRGAVGGSSVGMASYYAREHDGHRTASGERYDMHAMTAAHPTLAFGTRVRVTNLANGRRAVVRINDRGPFRRGRIIDVSYAAARELKMIGPGVARVRLVVL